MANGVVDPPIPVIAWEDIYSRHGAKLAEIERFLESFEREHSFRLTLSAVEILLIPIVEGLERGYDVDDAEVAETLRRIVSQMAEDPDPRDERNGIRSAWSALRAIWRQWCNIPPICRETQEGE